MKKTLQSLALFFVAIPIVLAETTDTCTMVNQNSRINPKDPNHIIMYSNNFWDAEQYSNSTIKTNIGSLVKTMPHELKRKTGLSSKDRALQLQWALYVANRFINNKTHLFIQPCNYDFSDLSETHMSMAATDNFRYQLFLPKLFINRNNITLSSASGTTKPKLYYSGVGRDGINHGRVLLMVKSGVNNVVINGINFTGDHSTANLNNVHYHLHENQAEVNQKLLDKDTTYGLIMVGMVGETNLKNGVTVQNCELNNINMNGAVVIGNTNFKKNIIRGVLPVADSTYFILKLVNFHKYVLEPNAKTMGFHFQSGITIEGNSFYNLLQGVTAGSSKIKWNFIANVFNTIADHAIYIGGEINKAIISKNTFIRIFDEAIKLTGDQPHETSEPAAAKQAATNSVISNNTFNLVRKSSIYLQGVGNKIYDNSIIKSNNAGFYDNSNIYFPHIWLGTQVGSTFAHAASNNIEGNRYVIAKNTNGNVYGKLITFMEQRPVPPNKIDEKNNMSLQNNCVLGKPRDDAKKYYEQEVYLYVRKQEKYPPILHTDNAVNVVFNAPTECQACYPDGSDYFKKEDANVELNHVNICPGG
jgi:hypothetical protein